MYLLKVLVVLVISIAIYGHKHVHWIEEGGICRREYGPDEHCIHYSNCAGSKYGDFSKGHPEFCRFSEVHPIFCCVETDSFTDNDSSEEPFIFHGEESGYEKPHGEDEEEYPHYLYPYEPPSYHWQHPVNEQKPYNGHKNPVTEQKQPDYAVSKPEQKPNKGPTDGQSGGQNNEQSGGQNRGQSGGQGDGQNRTQSGGQNRGQSGGQGDGQNRTQSGGQNRGQSGGQGDGQNRTQSGGQNRGQSGGQGDGQNRTQSGGQSGGQRGGQSSSQSSVNIQEPFYSPTLQNSTSLQKCREYVTQVPPPDDVVRIAVVGGRPATPGEFPHLALLGYGEESNIQWSCGGTLISDQYILTAAHCLIQRDVGPVRYVRLGELDLNTTSEDVDRRDFTVVESIRHPLYTIASTYYDIALLRLNVTVAPFSNYIKPACLGATKNVSGLTLVIAGWGLTEDGGEKANVLQTTNLNHVTNERCRRIYGTPRTTRQGILEDLQVCADGGGERRDACQGDSGGPLQITNRNYTSEFSKFAEIVGVTSFGMKCGITAGVYTRVQPYVQWIESIVWPTQS